jgi:hypothetical protein
MPRLRVMGTGLHGDKLFTQPLADAEGIPLAFVIERDANWKPRSGPVMRWHKPSASKNVTLAR